MEWEKLVFLVTNILKKKNNIKIFDDTNINERKYSNKSYLKINEIKKLDFDYILVSPGINIEKCRLKTYLKKYFSQTNLSL